MSQIGDRIIDRINREIGSDLKNLHKCTNIVKEYELRVTEIEDEVCLQINCNIQLYI